MPNLKPGELSELFGISPDEVQIIPSDKKGEFFAYMKNEPKESAIPLIDFCSLKYDEFYENQILNLKNNSEYLKKKAELNDINHKLNALYLKSNLKLQRKSLTERQSITKNLFEVQQKAASRAANESNTESSKLALEFKVLKELTERSEQLKNQIQTIKSDTQKTLNEKIKNEKEQIENEIKKIKDRKESKSDYDAYINGIPNPLIKNRKRWASMQNSYRDAMYVQTRNVHDIGHDKPKNPSIHLLNIIKKLKTQFETEVEQLGLKQLALLLQQVDSTDQMSLPPKIYADLLTSKMHDPLSSNDLKAAFNINENLIQLQLNKYIAAKFGFNYDEFFVKKSSDYHLYYKKCVVNASSTPQEIILILKETCDKPKTNPEIFFETGSVDEFGTKKTIQNANKIMTGKSAAKRIIRLLEKNETATLTEVAEITLRIKAANIDLKEAGHAFLARKLESYTQTLEKNFDKMIQAIAELENLDSKKARGLPVEPEAYEKSKKAASENIHAYKSLVADYNNALAISVPEGRSKRNRTFKSLLKDKAQSLQLELDKKINFQTNFLRSYQKKPSAATSIHPKTNFSKPPILLSADTQLNPNKRGLSIEGLSQPPKNIKDALADFIHKEKTRLKYLEIEMSKEHPNTMTVWLPKKIHSQDITDQHLIDLQQIAKKTFEADPTQTFTIAGLEPRKAIKLYELMKKGPPGIEKIHFSEKVRKNIEATNEPRFLAILKELDDKNLNLGAQLKSPGSKPQKPKSGNS